MAGDLMQKTLARLDSYMVSERSDADLFWLNAVTLSWNMISGYGWGILISLAGVVGMTFSMRAKARDRERQYRAHAGLH
jgi:hypothetical protein